MALIKTNARSSSQLDATILTGNLPAINGSALTNISAGKILQVQYDNKQSTASSTALATAGNWTDLLSVNITPAATSSKILVSSSSF